MYITCTAVRYGLPRGARDIHLYFNSTTTMHLEPFVMHSALPARPRPLVTSLQLVEVWPYLEEEEDIKEYV